MLKVVIDESLEERLKKQEELVWINPHRESKSDLKKIYKDSIDEAEELLERFAPFIYLCFPETKEMEGIIESPLTLIPNMKKLLNDKYKSKIEGKLYLKEDNKLAIAGSVKARGGIYEVLKYTEELLIEKDLLKKSDDYSKLRSQEYQSILSEYTIQVGSTGNLGLSIGIASKAIGYKVIIHMSEDAKKWKKDLLKEAGVKVVEYKSDYSEAVKKGRKESENNPKSYFIDDENSIDLFLGYGVAARRLERQLEEEKIRVDKDNPLFVYIPCGVGGAPGGITYGLRELFESNVHCFFIEPTKTPCMLLGMATGKHNEISVRDIGLSQVTHADGLAVARPSGFIGKVMDPILSGIFTVEDFRLYDYMRDLLESENIFLEPSASASFEGVRKLNYYKETKRYINDNNLKDKMKNSTHIVWATGGSLVPEAIREEYKNIYLKN